MPTGFIGSVVTAPADATLGRRSRPSISRSKKATCCASDSYWGPLGKIVAATTRSGSNPGSTCCRSTRLRRWSPAATRRMTESATSATMSPRRMRPLSRPDVSRSPDAVTALDRPSPTALSAGSTPQRNVTGTSSTSVKATTRPSSVASRHAGSSPGSNACTSGTAHAASATPAAVPSATTAAHSITSRRISRPGAPPSAARMASSRPRSRARARKR